VQRLAVALLTILALVSLCAACGKSASKAASSETYGATPEEAALAWAKAMQGGDAETAAAYWAYNEEARRQNEDWDSIPSGQRAQIIAKVREERIATLKTQMAVWRSATGQLTAQVSGDSVVISADGQRVAQIGCAKTAKGYQVYDPTAIGAR